MDMFVAIVVIIVLALIFVGFRRDMRRIEQQFDKDMADIKELEHIAWLRQIGLHDTANIILAGLM